MIEIENCSHHVYDLASWLVIDAILGLWKWSRKKFGNSKLMIDTLLLELSSLHNSGSYCNHKERMETIVHQLDELWTREELHWHQRSRVR